MTSTAARTDTSTDSKFHIKVANLFQERLANETSVLLQNPNTRAFAPYNGSSGKHFADINQLILAQEAVDRGFASPVWVTDKQIQKLGGELESKAAPIAVQFVSWEDDKGKALSKPQYSTYEVYNLEQTTLKENAKALKHPDVLSKAEIAVASHILANKTPTSTSESIGNWMAAAIKQADLPDTQAVNAGELLKHLKGNNQTEIIVLARKGSSEVGKVERAINDAKDIGLKLYVNQLTNPQSHDFKTDTANNVKSAKVVPEKEQQTPPAQEPKKAMGKRSPPSKAKAPRQAARQH